MVPAIGVDHPPVEVHPEPTSILLPISTVPAILRKITSVNSPGPEHETAPIVSTILQSRSSSLITAHLTDDSTHHFFPRCSQYLHATCEDYCG